jgi:hypothetical protein
MKAIGILLLAGAMAARAAAAQAVGVAQVPASVRQAFAAKFPTVHTAVAWKATPYQSWVADFNRMGADVKATFRPTGAWVESATEIGAITLPDVVRNAIVKDYRGYRFVETRRLDRAAPPALLFEIRLDRSGNFLTVRYEPGGRLSSTHLTAAQPVVSVAGTWRGESTCPATAINCHGETVVYHISPAGTDTSAFDAQTNRVVDGREESIAKLPCTLDRARALLLCSPTNGAWEFQVRHDSLIGGLTSKDGTPASHVIVHRTP